MPGNTGGVQAPWNRAGILKSPRQNVNFAVKMPPPSSNPANHAIFSAAEWSRLAREFGLTGREISVAKAMIDEKSDAQIAGQLGVTEADVTIHRSDVLQKTVAGSSVTLLLSLFKALRRKPATRPKTL